MNVLTTTWRQLVRRRLWPVALLLLAALAAVPFLLARDPEPVVPQGPATVPAAKADDALAEPVVAQASPEDRDRRRRVLGATKDPFEPAPLPKAEKPEQGATTVVAATGRTAEPITGGAGTGGSGGATSAPVAPSVPGTSLPAPAPGPVSVTPAPKKKAYPKGSVMVRFGDATGTGLARMNVPKLAPLPDDENPLLVYMGLTDHRKRAVFLIDASLEPSGDGRCEPHPSTCETVELAKGETEFFDVVDPATGTVTAQYELDLLAIK